MHPSVAFFSLTEHVSAVRDLLLCIYDVLLWKGCNANKREARVQEVSDAIFEGVLPRSANDIVPRTEAGLVVSTVDKLDSLVGLAAVGCLPSSGADRYGLRRITYGLLQTLIGSSVHASLRQLVGAAAAVQPVSVLEATQQEIVEFATRRLEQYILDQGWPLASWQQKFRVLVRFLQQLCMWILCDTEQGHMQARLITRYI